MFGYIRLSKDKKSNEAGLAQTFMCGLCLSTKKLFGNKARNLVNHDVNFLNVLFHSYLGVDAQVTQGRCLSSFVKKRSLLVCDDITDALSVANVLLCYAALQDKIRDKQSRGGKILLALLEKDYQKAAKLNPELDAQIQAQCTRLVTLEQQNCDSPDVVCDCFAQLAVFIAKAVMPNASQDLYDLTYNVGKWIYLIDALDDIEKDVKKKNYNLLASYFCVAKPFDKQEFLQRNAQQLQYLFYTALNRIAECYNDLNLNKYVCVLQDVLYNSIRDKTKELLGAQNNAKETK